MLSGYTRVTRGRQEVDEPDLEFGTPPPATDIVLDKALAVLNEPAATKNKQ